VGKHVSVGEREGRNRLEDLGVSGRVLIKWISKEVVYRDAD
jgi:hypothetical protein